MDHALCHHDIYAQMEDCEVLLNSNDVELKQQQQQTIV